MDGESVPDGSAPGVATDILCSDDIAMSELIPRYLRHLRARGFARSTIEARDRLLRHADHWLPYGLEEADRGDLEEYLGEQDWSDWTRYTYDGHLRGYYEWAVDADDGLTINPMHRMPKPRKGDCVPNPVTNDEMRAALERSPRQPWGMAIMLCAYAGLRASEAARLTRADVTEDHVRVKHGKGGADRTVDMAPELWRYLRDEPPGQLIRTARGRPMSGKYLINYQCEHWRRIGLPEVHLHRFRHWLATTLLRNGVDLRTVQEVMRHESITSTQGYTLVVDEQRRAAIRTLPTMRAVNPGPVSGRPGAAAIDAGSAA